MISIKDLQFAYSPSTKKILDIKELRIAEGEKVFLYGASGTGKSTLLELLAGILVPSSGSLNIAGCELQDLSGSERDRFRARHIGYIFQSFNLIPYLTASENILLPLELNSGGTPVYSSREERDHSLQEIAKQLGIDAYLKRSVLELSVGQQQRVAVARALMARPRVILADEPTSALDEDHRERFLKLVFELCQANGITLVFVSHDKSIQHLFDRSIALSSINSVKVESAEAGL